MSIAVLLSSLIKYSFSYSGLMLSSLSLISSHAKNLLNVSGSSKASKLNYTTYYYSKA